MTRFFAAAAILSCFVFPISYPIHGQSNPSTAIDNGCFPWQEFRNGQCVGKAMQTPPPLPRAEPAPAPAVVPASPAPPPPPAAAIPCLDGTRNVSGRCICPANAHYEATDGHCVADLATQWPDLNRVCDGGTLTNGTCACPAGFGLMAAPGNAGGGTCVRTDAENCLGGELTVSGKCMCSGQVKMSGETYLLEYSNGKCLPMDCPVTALLGDGKCPVASSAPSAPEPQSTERPAPRHAKEAPEEQESTRHCGRGTVHTRYGCVPAHRQHLPNMWGFRQYYRNYQLPGMRN